MKTLRYLILFLAPLASAQVPISANHIVDSFEHPIAVAKLCFVPVDATHAKIAFRVGTTQIIPNEVCGNVNMGVLQSGLSVAPTPTGVLYHIYLKQAFSNVISWDYGLTPITGPTWTLDTFDSNFAPVNVPSISVGTITMLPPGSGGSCGIVGASPYVLNCSIPQGAVGPTGSAAGFYAGASYSGTFNQLVTDVLTASKTITISSTMNAVTNTTVSADRSILVLGGGLLTCSSGVTITFLGDFYADPNHQAFDSSCTIHGLKWARPEWFGTNSICPPVLALGTSGGTVYLQRATYDSCFTSAPTALQQANVTIQGAGEPSVDSATSPTKLVGGSIITNSFAVYADNFTIRDVGIDVGSAWNASKGGPARDGFVINNDGQVLGRPQYKNPRIENVIALGSSPTASNHSLLIENVDHAFIHNVTAMFNTHCFAYKGTNGYIDGFYSKGCHSDGFTIKSDNYAVAGSTNINNGIIESATPGDSNGFIVQADEVDAANINVKNILVKNVFNYGLQLLVNAGTIRTLNISNFTSDNTGSPTPPSSCAIITGATGSSPTNMNKINIDNFNCLNAGNGIFTDSINPIDFSLSNSKFSNIGTNVLSTTGNWTISNLQIRTAGANAIVNNGGTVRVSNEDFTGVSGLAHVPSSGPIIGWGVGTADPSGACSTGETYSNTTGGTGHAFWVCVSSAWVNVK